MTSIHIYDPGDGAALPELPPLPIGVLVVGTADLLQQAADLPQPHYITISSTQSVDFQFAPEQASVRAITRWALRFGSVITSQPHHGQGRSRDLAPGRLRLLRHRRHGVCPHPGRTGRRLADQERSSWRNRRREPPSVSSVTQHVLRGTLDTQVQADIAYTVEGHIKFHLGPVFLVLKGREAALSMRELIDKLAPVIDEMYPDLDAELRRQHREILRQATLDSYSRARVNGTEPAAVIMARQAAYYITT